MQFDVIHLRRRTQRMRADDFYAWVDFLSLAFGSARRLRLESIERGRISPCVDCLNEQLHGEDKLVLPRRCRLDERLKKKNVPVICLIKNNSLFAPAQALTRPIACDLDFPTCLDDPHQTSILCVRSFPLFSFSFWRCIPD